MSHFLWTKKQDIGPAPRIGHSMTYDSDRKRVVLFGGDSLRTKLFNDTWEWDGENWTQISDIGPLPRREFAMAYDSKRQRVVLFGGISGDGLLADTWEWDGEDWTQVADSRPSPRSGHSLVFDNIQNCVMLFGGEALDAQLMNDTWKWDGDNWTQEEDTGPSPRKSHSVASDTFRNRIVLFGGHGSEGTGLRDTWEWNGGNWTQVTAFGPDFSLGGAMVYTGVRVAYYGGVDSLNVSPPPRVFGNTWEWDGKHWIQRQDIGPGPKWLHAMAFDNSRQRIVLFGGLSIFAPEDDPKLANHILGDTWEHYEEDIPLVQTPPPPVEVPITLTNLTPNHGGPYSPDENITLLVTLSGPAPANTIVELTSGHVVGDSFPKNLVIPVNATTAVYSFPATTFVGGVFNASVQVVIINAKLGNVVKTIGVEVLDH